MTKKTSSEKAKSDPKIISKSKQPKCRKFKQIVRNCTVWREKQEIECREQCWYSCIPILACFCLQIKYTFIILMEPLVVPIGSIFAIVTFFARLFRCHHGQDCFYSLLEIFVVADECIGFYFDVAWWREQKGEGIDDLNPVHQV